MDASGYVTASRKEAGPYRGNHVPRKPIMQHVRMDNITPSDPTSNRRRSTRTACVKLATGCRRTENQVSCRNYATGSNSKRLKLTIGTWNVRGLNTPGKLQVVENALCGQAITGISETHWRSNGHFISINDNLIYHPAMKTKPLMG